jgi:hypothetical protein
MLIAFHVAIDDLVAGLDGNHAAVASGEIPFRTIIEGNNLKTESSGTNPIG